MKIINLGLIRICNRVIMVHPGFPGPMAHKVPPSKACHRIVKLYKIDEPDRLVAGSEIWANNEPLTRKSAL